MQIPFYFKTIKHSEIGRLQDMIFKIYGMISRWVFPRYFEASTQTLSLRNGIWSESDFPLTDLYFGIRLRIKNNKMKNYNQVDHTKWPDMKIKKLSEDWDARLPCLFQSWYLNTLDMYIDKRTDWSLIASTRLPLIWPPVNIVQREEAIT